jgi:hypothetical protein
MLAATRLPTKPSLLNFMFPLLPESYLIPNLVSARTRRQATTARSFFLYQKLGMIMQALFLIVAVFIHASSHF